MRSGRSLSTPDPSANGAYDRTADNPRAGLVRPSLWPPPGTAAPLQLTLAVSLVGDARHQFVMNSRQRDEPLFRRCPIGALGQLPTLASPADDAMVPCQRLPMLLTTRAAAVD